MAQFHFNAIAGNRIIPDLEGEELPDIDAVRKVAMQSARETLAHSIKFGDDPPEMIQVTDSDGHEVLTLPLVEVLPERMRK